MAFHYTHFNIHSEVVKRDLLWKKVSLFQNLSWEFDRMYQTPCRVQYIVHNFNQATLKSIRPTQSVQLLNIITHIIEFRTDFIFLEDQILILDRHPVFLVSSLGQRPRLGRLLRSSHQKENAISYMKCRYLFVSRYLISLYHPC